MTRPAQSRKERVFASVLKSAGIFFRNDSIPLFCLLGSLGCGGAAGIPPPPTPPLKVLFLTGGGYHDYKTLAPHLTRRIGELIAADFYVQFGLEALRGPKFPGDYSAVIYDGC